MQSTETQPHAAPISHTLVSAILAEAVDSPSPPEYEVRQHGEFSNDVAVVTVDSGARLMIKRGRHPWSHERFAVSRQAAQLLSAELGIVAPEPLDVDLPEDHADQAVEAYWRIELPIFADLWKQADEEQRRYGLHSLGALIRHLHLGSRPIVGDRPPMAAEPFSISALQYELTQRLQPAVAGEWPSASDLVGYLIETAPTLFRQNPVPVLLHGDLHLGNVFCEPEGDLYRSVGLLDLEWVHTGPAESDLARFRAMHEGPFGMELPSETFEWLHQGYEARLDEDLFRFYLLYHYLNLGLYSAMIGDREHADAVEAYARAAWRG